MARHAPVLHEWRTVGAGGWPAEWLLGDEMTCGSEVLPTRAPVWLRILSVDGRMPVEEAHREGGCFMRFCAWRRAVVSCCGP